MYFKIGPIGIDPQFSWILVKNPTSIFSKNLTKDDCVAEGKFDEYAQHYIGSVYNSPTSFLEIARKLNMSNYLHVQLSAVCPHNLRGFDLVFRSVLRGNVESSNLSETNYFTPKLFEATMGPYPCNKSFVSEIFASVGIIAEAIEDGMTSSFVFNFHNPEPMSTTEFFQKLYLISYFLTINHSLTPINTDQVEKFANLCKNWLELSPFRNRIINTLCKRNPNLIQKFEKNIAEDEEEVDKRFEKINEEKAKRLHELRHQLIIENLPIEDAPTKTERKNIIDLGCSNGNLIRKMVKFLPETNFIGIDADFIRIERARRKHTKNASFINTNILFPKNIDELINVDYMILTEIIEHLHKKDRQELLYLIDNVYCPKSFILTSPNVDYNINYNLAEGEYRHSDHKIEWTENQFQEEIINSLQEKYDIEVLKVVPEEEMQSTFAIKGVRKDKNFKPNYKAIDKIKSKYDSVYLEISDYNINKSQLNTGYTSRSFLSNGSNIFYMAPTMAPVNYNPQFPDYLEHPETCFEYYRQRGITHLIGEEKYMGSRAELLIFKDKEKANMTGYEHPVIVNSRSGYEFFDDEETKNKIHDDIKNKMVDDFIILDAEIMPWNYKADKLIMKEFLSPIESTLLSRKYTDKGSLENAQKALLSLGRFSKESPIEIRPFHILAKGNVVEKKGKRMFSNIEVGFLKNHIQHMTEIEFLTKDGIIFKPCKWHSFDLNDQYLRNESIKRWEDFCQIGEGFVYKPYDFLNYAPNYHLIQPAMKVRGKEYLRIIYGIDYLEPECFQRLTHRHTIRKRILAIQEQELAIKILLSFLKGNRMMKEKFVAAFIGMESVNMANIDATL